MPVYLKPKYSATIPLTEPPAKGSNILPPFLQNQVYKTSQRAGSKILIVHIHNLLCTFGLMF